MTEKDVVELILKTSELLTNNPNAAVEAARLTVIGMVSVALIAVLGQFIATRYLVKSESEKVARQLLLDRQNQLNIAWQAEFKELLASLLYESDPEVNQKPNKKNIVKTIHKLNLMLNEDIPIQKELNHHINKLALSANGWLTVNESEIMQYQSSIINLGKQIVYQPSVDQDPNKNIKATR